ncbi:MAG: hypothetical protein ACTSQE_06995 [Candidatus Heimdallarchaeaceae archaeon]
MPNLQEKIIEILHKHTRRIITEGENKPLVRREIKSQTAKDIIKTCRQEITKEVIEELESMKWLTPRPVLGMSGSTKILDRIDSKNIN